MDFDKMEVVKAENEEEAFFELCKELGFEKEEDKDWALNNYIIIPVPKKIRDLV